MKKLEQLYEGKAKKVAFLSALYYTLRVNKLKIKKRIGVNV